MIVIDDSIHCDLNDRFTTFDDAIAELKLRAAMAWDEPPNRAPCKGWRECGRAYDVLELDPSHKPWKLLRRIPVLKVSAKGAEWVEGFEQAWTAAQP